MRAPANACACRYGSYGPFAPAYDATKSFTGGLTSAVVGDSAMQRLHEIAQQCQVRSAPANAHDTAIFESAISILMAQMCLYMVLQVLGCGSR